MSDQVNRGDKIENQACDQSFEGLLNLARSGDQGATAELVDQYRDYLLFLANANMEPVLKSKLGASDIVQQSMLAVCQNLQGFRGSSEPEFKGWIRKILQNQFLNSKRHFSGTQQRQINQEVRLNDSKRMSPDLIDSESTPQACALLGEMATELDRCVGLLSESHQQVLRLRNWQEKSFNEIGQILGCSPDAARKMWFFAFQRLREKIIATRPEFASHLTAFSKISHSDGS